MSDLNRKIITIITITTIITNKLISKPLYLQVFTRCLFAYIFEMQHTAIVIFQGLLKTCQILIIIILLLIGNMVPYSSLKGSLRYRIEKIEGVGTKL